MAQIDAKQAEIDLLRNTSADVAQTVSQNIQKVAQNKPMPTNTTTGGNMKQFTSVELENMSDKEFQELGKSLGIT